MQETFDAETFNNNENETVQKESRPLLENYETVQTESSEAIHCENIEKLEELRNRIAQNREDGRQREESFHSELLNKFPEDKGYSIARESYLRNAEGKIAMDPESKERRRLDFVVIEGNTPKAVYELTSPNVNKSLQIGKENRIRQEGGNYILDPHTGKLIEIPANVQTVIRRME